MIGELSIINEWIPEQMEPGTVFVLENAGEVGEREDPYWAVLSCPSCGTLGLITRKQMAGLLPTICGSAQCSAQFFIKDGARPRHPMSIYVFGTENLTGTCSTISISNPSSAATLLG
jgi:hypothetical protein